ncbi:folylpolyglutamate synthase [Aspergillus floccosus]
MKRTYENALKRLETRRRKARPQSAAAPAPPDADNVPGTSTLKGVPSLVGMKEWLQVLGHSDNDLSRLNIVHIAGTKGKGSTCAFIRSFLHAHGLRTGFPKRIGLYTSPDLRCIRERIQINNQPITEDRFTQYFFEVWERLNSPGSTVSAAPARKPRYLQFLALLAFHTFIREEVEAAIFETHHGGEYDATNVIPSPVVTGITSLGMDHVDQLGPTLADIAWHKTGIFKPEAPAFSVPQEPGLAEVMQKRAAAKGTSLQIVPPDSSLPKNNRVLSIPVQRLNCSLALEISRAFLRQKAREHELTTEDINLGVENFSWAGRFEVIDHGDSQWFLDGAHNTLSLGQVAEWYSKNLDSPPAQRTRVLIFSHYSEERDGVELVEHLASALVHHNARPSHVIFTTYDEREDGSTRIDKTLKVPETPFPEYRMIYTTVWNKFDPLAVVSSEPTIEGALKLARKIGGQASGMQVLVTGSLHLVGGALNILRP